MVHRGQVCDKWSRYCIGCGRKHHFNKIKEWSGNECCPGEGFTRVKTRVKA